MLDARAVDKDKLLQPAGDQVLDCAMITNLALISVVCQAGRMSKH